MSDIGMGAFGLFLLQSPSFLGHQTALACGRGTSNCQMLLGMDKIPTEHHIRTIHDPAPPETLCPMFAHTLAAIEARIHAQRATSQRPARGGPPPVTMPLMPPGRPLQR